MTAASFGAWRPLPRTRRGRCRASTRCLLTLEQLEARNLLDSSLVYPSYVVFHRAGAFLAGSLSPIAGALTPSALRQVYGIDLLSADGSGETVAIIDAYDNPNLVSRNATLPAASDTAFLSSDLHQFDLAYGLPEPPGFFTKVNQSGGTSYPKTDPAGAGNNNWETEEALDVEWVHALAPGARIILVEANTSSIYNLCAGVAWAGGQSGAQVVTMCWGIGEYSKELSFDNDFVQPANYGVTYLAATGDAGAPSSYPAFSPEVVAVGGTTLQVDGSGNYSAESGWSLGGGGISPFEAQPPYQGSITQCSPHRSTPDVSFDADPATGVSVYDSYDGAVSGGPWYQLGGTSLASPAWGALVARADQIRASDNLPSLNGATQTLPTLYRLPPGDFHDITSGNNGFAAGPGYDLVSGIGTPVANKLVPDLAGVTIVTSSTPASGTVLSALPNSYTLTFSTPIDPSSLSASALQVNGIAASSVTLDATGTEATFTFSNSPVTSAGQQSLSLAADTVTAAGYGFLNAPYTASFSIKSTFSQYLVTVAGGSTVQAGKSFLVSVQAADAFGNPVASYDGPAAVTLSLTPGPSSSTASDFPGTMALNSSGMGVFLASIQQAGSYTIAAVGSDPLNGVTTNGSTASPITVAPGPAALLAFTAQPQNTPTGVALPAVTVQVQDLFGNLITSDNGDIVTLSIASGPGPGAPGFTAGSTTAASTHNGVATFNNLILIVPGSYVLSARVSSLYTGPNSHAFTIAPLQVIPGTLVGTAVGFSLQFNAPFLTGTSSPVLYGQGFGTSGIAPSVILTSDPGNLSDTAAYINGSLMLDTADNRITFVTTTTANLSDSGLVSPLLRDGIYAAIVRSSAATDGFHARASGGGYLDGLGSGKPGSGDFRATFTVNAAAGDDDILWIPPTADGPGQPLNAPGKNQVGGGYPIYLSDSTGSVTQVQVTLNYNPALLTVTGVSGTGFSLLASSTPGQAILQYSGPALPTGVQTPIGYLLATVPSGTAADSVPYRAAQLLHLSDVSLNGGVLPVLSADALHLVAYVGDADGNGMYNSNDAMLIYRALLGSDSGFSAYPLVDPVIVADTDGAGFIPADAALQINEVGTGFPTATLPMPPIPAGVIFVVSNSSLNAAVSLQTTLQDSNAGSSAPAVTVQQAQPSTSTRSQNTTKTSSLDPIHPLSATSARHAGRRAAIRSFSTGTSPDNAGRLVALDQVFAETFA